MKINFALALSAISHVGYFASRVLLALIAIRLGASPFIIGVLGALFALFPMLLSVMAGRLSDRRQSRHLMMLSSAGACLAMLLPALWTELPLVLAAALLYGLSQMFFIVPSQNLIGLLSTSETRARNFANQSLTISAGNFAGPMLAGWAVDHFSAGQSSLIVAVVAGVPLLLLLARRGALEPEGHEFVRKHRGGATTGGAAALLKQADVRRTLYTSCVLVVGANLYNFYMPVYAHSVGVSATLIGVVMAGNSGAAFIVRMALPRLIKSVGDEAVLAGGFLCGCVALLMVPLFASALPLGLLSLLFGVGMGVVQPISTMQMFAVSQKGRSGESIGLRMAVNQVTALISPLVFGAVAAAAGLLATFWLNALLLGTGSYLSRPRARSGG